MENISEIKQETNPVEITIPETAEIVKEKVSKVSIVPQWRRIFLTWSFWLHMGSVILTFIDQLLPFLGLLEPTMTTQTYALLMFTFNGLGLFARFIKQRKLWEYKPEDKDNVQ